MFPGEVGSQPGGEDVLGFCPQEALEIHKGGWCLYLHCASLLLKLRGPLQVSSISAHCVQAPFGHWIYLNMLLIQIVEIKNQELHGPHVVIEYVYYTNNF